MTQAIEFPYLEVCPTFANWEEITVIKIYKVWYINDAGYIEYIRYLDGKQAEEHLQKLQNKNTLSK